jgi:uncharacterized protein YfaT (DUF1175 family)
VLVKKSLRVFVVLFLIGMISPSATNATPLLNAEQSRIFRQWFLLIVQDQLQRPPNPRWQHRDCAGLVRFAVAESLREHDMAWRQANGFTGRPLPPELVLDAKVRVALKGWRVPGQEEKSDFAAAAALVQNNTNLVGREVLQARPGDLVYFDQGEDQHVMIWTGSGFAYHTGAESDREKKIRYVPYTEMLKWKDARWWPVEDNPNFDGVYRFSFLSY